VVPPIAPLPAAPLPPSPVVPPVAPVASPPLAGTAENPYWSDEIIPPRASVPSNEGEEARRAREQEEKRREDQRKLNQQIILIAVVIVIAVAFTFLFVIAPKFMGLQILPIDPFGYNKAAPAVSEGDGEKAPAGADAGTAPGMAIEAPGIQSLVLGIGRYGSDDETIDGTYGDDGTLSLKTGAAISILAVVDPKEAAAGAEFEWTVAGDSGAAECTWAGDEATLFALAPGEVTVTVRAEGSGLSVAKNTLHIVIVPAEPEDVIYPVKGTIFITNEAKLGIFVRSEHLVNGESKTLNDGNKIAWIAGGNTSVELIATGNEYNEGADGYWWYEVEVPQTYRDTAKQKENYAGKPLIGWVRSDVVKEK
jgi:hypothetical protein